jgi:tetratricopeptide (TPR) repeat protein
MRVTIAPAALLAAALLAGACADETPSATTAETAAPLGGPSAAEEAEWRQPLFEGLGGIHFPITTGSEKAQQYFDQGLSLAWAFNHAAADFAFNEAALHDPDCGMCLWGSALVLGPNVNAAMAPDAAPRARALAERADALVRANGTDKERALTAALLQRYAADPPADRTPLDVAWADAMRDVVARFPDDVHLTTLKAEALMDLHPWDFWLADGEERPWTDEIVSTIETALAMNPDHAGAIHLYIHAVEQSQEAHRAEPYADRLADIAPAAGHLVHMPAHIYMRVGRYYDSTINNMKAADADAAFVAACRSNSPIYLAGYVPHNWHFGWVTAAMAGWREKAIEMAEGTAAQLTDELLRAPGMEVAQHFLMQPTFAHLRFAEWDAILATPAPAEDLVYARGLWHFARGMALLNTGDAEGAAAEHATLESIRNRPDVAAMPFFNRSEVPLKVLSVAERMLAGERAAAAGDLDGALAALSEGVLIEDSIPYSEPPDWYYPVRHALGRVQLAAGDAAAAEATYRADLAVMPENGWALIGLETALRDQGRTAEADAVHARFEAAWQHADTAITASTI